MGSAQRLTPVIVSHTQLLYTHTSRNEAGILAAKGSSRLGRTAATATSGGQSPAQGAVSLTEPGPGFAVQTISKHHAPRRSLAKFSYCTMFVQPALTCAISHCVVVQQICKHGWLVRSAAVCDPSAEAGGLSSLVHELRTFQVYCSCMHASWCRQVQHPGARRRSPGPVALGEEQPGVRLSVQIATGA